MADTELDEIHVAAAAGVSVGHPERHCATMPAEQFHKAYGLPGLQ